MSDDTPDLQLSLQQRKESVEDDDQAPPKAPREDLQWRASLDDAQIDTPSGSFIDTARSLSMYVEPSREGAVERDTVLVSDDVSAQAKEASSTINVACTPEGSVTGPLFASAPMPSNAIRAGGNEESITGKVQTVQNDRDQDEYDPRHPKPISSAGASMFTASFANTSLIDPHATDGLRPLDFSKTGIVHLPPLPSTSPEHSSSQSSRISLENPASHSDALCSPDSRDNSATGSESDGQNRKSSSSNSAVTHSGSDSGDMLVTQRLQSETNEHGHFVVTGREGRLVRCEDEPIRAPGAVQGFGVFIAVEEDDERGNLLVRQVSENAFELLGLSPQYLFSLECFTQTLPGSQADMLWTNVQHLQDSDVDSESVASDTPLIFLLSGWGEPNSAISDDDDGQEKANDENRRFWTCWCAAHRPPQGKCEVAIADKGSRSIHPRTIIILEFELEHDVYNPLYPPLSHRQMATTSPDSIDSTRGSLNVGTVGSAAGSSGSSTATSLIAGSSGGSLTDIARTADSSTPTTRLDPSVGGTTPSNIPDAQAGDNQKPSQLLPMNPAELFLSSQKSFQLDGQWFPRPEDVFESTTSHSKPLRALERIRQIDRKLGSFTSSPAGDSGGSSRRRAGARSVAAQAGIGTMDIFAILSQINDQLGSTTELEALLKTVVGVVKDLTQFHRVLIYQFDDVYNGQVVAELVDWNQTHDLYKGLHFPASDIPAQARELYQINKVRLLYNRSQTTARLVVRSREDLDPPLASNDMTHSFLRAMSPFHVKYLENMGVRSSMSISIMSFGSLWGLISCHSYGTDGMRVSFPVRQMLLLLSDSVSRNIERLSYTQRIRTRKLISTLPTDSHPTGFIMSDAEDLVGLFDADFGVLVIGEGAKILGPNEHGQEVLLVAEYLRLKRFNLMQVSQSIVKDFPDLRLPSGLEVIAGVLCIPLARGGKDFIAFLRKGHLRDVHWAGKPLKEGDGELEPRKSFKVWSESIAGRCRAWTDEQMETAGILALVYGKFIDIWRERETALKATQLTSLMIFNASNEVRTPLHHIINYLEMALNGPLDKEIRENIRLSHSASKSLLFTINDLLDLTRLEVGNETSFNEPFDLHAVVADATLLYCNEANRRNIAFQLDVSESPTMVIGDAKKIRTVVSNLTANAVKYTETGSVSVTCRKFQEPRGLRNPNEVAVEIVVADTGCGIEPAKLNGIFREFERVESSLPPSASSSGLGLGLAVVARIVEQLGGQLRVDSKLNEGSRFSFLIPFELAQTDLSDESLIGLNWSPGTTLTDRSGTSSQSSEIDSFIEAISSDPMKVKRRRSSGKAPNVSPTKAQSNSSPANGTYDVVDSRFPIRGMKMDEFLMDKAINEPRVKSVPNLLPSATISAIDSGSSTPGPARSDKLRILVVEDERVNRAILVKRLALDGHTVVSTTNGQEAVEAVQKDCEFDCVLMDIQMPVLNGFDAAKKIRSLELFDTSNARQSRSLNGRLPIFAVSASLFERQREEMVNHGMDGWILKPINFDRLRTILRGIVDHRQRKKDVYVAGYDWELGGWLEDSVPAVEAGASGHDSDFGSPP